MKKIITTLLVFFCVNIFAQNLYSISTQKLTHSIKRIIFKGTSKKEACSDCYKAKFMIDWFDEVNDIAKGVNRSIFTAVSDVMSNEYCVTSNEYIDELGIDNYKLIAEQFAATHDDPFGDPFLGMTSVRLHTNKLLSVVFSYQYFTGNSTFRLRYSSLFVDLKTGKKLTIDDLFIDKDKFTEIAESYFGDNRFFITENGNGKDRKLNSVLSSKDFSFRLPAAISMFSRNPTDNYLNLTYSIDELESLLHEEGIKIVNASNMQLVNEPVEIPLDVIKDYLNPDYFDF